MRTPRGPQRPPGSHGAVRGEEHRTAPAHDVDELRHPLEQRPRPGDATGDQHQVGHGAQGDDGDDVLTEEALAEHEGVLRTDGGDEPQTQTETGEGRYQRGIHPDEDAMCVV